MMDTQETYTRAEQMMQRLLQQGSSHLPFKNCRAQIGGDVTFKDAPYKIVPSEGGLKVVWDATLPSEEIPRQLHQLLCDTRVRSTYHPDRRELSVQLTDASLEALEQLVGKLPPQTEVDAGSIAPYTPEQPQNEIS